MLPETFRTSRLLEFCSQRELVAQTGHYAHEGHGNGKWFAEQVAQLVPDPDQTVHLRGLFYRIVAAGDVRRPDGSPFMNDLDCWVWLQTKAAKAARWLAYVPFDRIRRTSSLGLSTGGALVDGEQAYERR